MTILDNSLGVYTTANFSTVTSSNSLLTIGGNTVGNMRLNDNDTIEVYDGTDWIKTFNDMSDFKQERDNIINEIAENYPEVLADLVLKGIVK